MSDAAVLAEACAVLGVDLPATAQQVRAAWKRTLKRAHPDVGGTKKTAQHATNMRDVLLAWITAGRPAVKARVDPASAVYAGASWQAPCFAWQQAMQSQRPYSWRRCWIIVAIWASALLSSLLPVAWKEYARAPKLEPQFASHGSATAAQHREEMWPIVPAALSRQHEAD